MVFYEDYKTMVHLVLSMTDVNSKLIEGAKMSIAINHAKSLSIKQKKNLLVLLWDMDINIIKV